MNSETFATPFFPTKKTLWANVGLGKDLDLGFEKILLEETEAVGGGGEGGGGHKGCVHVPDTSGCMHWCAGPVIQFPRWCWRTPLRLHRLGQAFVCSMRRRHRRDGKGQQQQLCAEERLPRSHLPKCPPLSVGRPSP